MTSYETDRPRDFDTAEDEEPDDNDVRETEAAEEDIDLRDTDETTDDDAADTEPEPAETEETTEIADEPDYGAEPEPAETEETSEPELPETIDTDDEPAYASELETAEDDTDVTEPEATEPSPLERLEPVAPGTPIDPGTGTYQERWSAIQTGFIDDPHRAVEGASSLLVEMWESIGRTIADEREGIDGRWRDAARSTDELRVAMQDYRTLYTRLTSFTQATDT